MIRRITTSAILGTAAAAALVAGMAKAGAVAGPAVALASMSSLDAPAPHGPRPPGHGPGWDGRHGNWDGRGGPGHGGGWDGVGGGWDGRNWWVTPQRCGAGHGHVARRNDRNREFYCQGGIFNGSPIHFR